MPDDQYRALARAIRSPMHHWWMRVGVWWLVVMVIAQASLGLPFLTNAGMPLQHMSYTATAFRRLTDYIGIPGYLYLPAVIWLAAAYICRKQVHAVVSTIPLPESRRLDQLTFRLCWWQGLWPLGLTLAGAVAYSVLAAGTVGYVMYISLPLHLVLGGVLHLVFLAAGLMVWGLAMLVYTGRLYPALLWLAAWLAAPIAASWFFRTIHWYLRVWNLPFAAVFLGTTLLLVLAFCSWRGYRALAPISYAVVLLVATCQISWADGAMLPVALLRSSQVHSSLVRGFGIDFMQPCLVPGLYTGPAFYVLGPGYITDGSGGRFIERSLGSLVLSSGFSDGNCWLLLGIIVLINLALIALQFLLVDWVLGHRLNRQAS